MYYIAMAGIRVRYYWRLLCIKLRMYRRLTQITIAGWLVKLAFWLSPDLKTQMGYTKDYYHNWEAMKYYHSWEAMKEAMKCPPTR